VRLPARERFKGSDLDTNQKLLTENDKRFYYTPTSTDAVQLTILQQTVEIDNDYAFVLNLPSVAEAKNITFVISVKQTGNAVTLTDFKTSGFSDSVDWGGDYTLDTADDSITLRSDGRSWSVVSNDIA